MDNFDSVSNSILESVNNINDISDWMDRLYALQLLMFAYMVHIGKPGERYTYITSRHNTGMPNILKNFFSLYGVSTMSTSSDSISLSCGTTIEFYTMDDVLRSGVSDDDKISNVFCLIDWTAYTEDEFRDAFSEFYNAVRDDITIEEAFIGIPPKKINELFN